MNETTPETSPDATATDAGQATTDAAPEPRNKPDDAPDESSRDRRNRERLRAADSERDRLRDALVPHLRAAIEQVAATKLASGASIWLVPGVDPLQLAQRVPSFDGGARPSARGGPSWRQVLAGPRD